MKICSGEVCANKKVGGVKRKGCKWWNEETGKHINEEKELFEQYIFRL